VVTLESLGCHFVCFQSSKDYCIFVQNDHGLLEIHLMSEWNVLLLDNKESDLEHLYETFTSVDFFQNISSHKEVPIAIQCFKQHPSRLVVLDYFLAPHITALDVCSKFQGAVVIIVSWELPTVILGNDWEALLSSKGVSAWLQKPLSQSDLMKVVNGLLHSPRLKPQLPPVPPIDGASYVLACRNGNIHWTKTSKD
jgi:hypothetical protein